MKQTKKDLKRAIILLKYPKLYLFWRITIQFNIWRLRYKHILNEKTHEVYLKDRLFFWRPVKKTNIMYIGK